MLNIVSYSESSSSDSENENIINVAVNKKRKYEAIDAIESTKVRKSNSDSETKGSSLPLPDDIKQLFTEQENKTSAEPSDHLHGRIRSFSHEEGNWATYVHIPIDPNQRWLELTKELMLALRPLEFQPMEHFHVSLSRTVVIRHHWIQPLVDSLGHLFKKQESTALQLESVKVYTNDEKTRSFLSITVEGDFDILRSYVDIVDTCFKEYNLEKYYSEPSFHISIGWALGDVTSLLLKEKLGRLQKILTSFLDKEPDLRFIEVEEIQCQTGNKVYCFPLQTS